MLKNEFKIFCCRSADLMPAVPFFVSIVNSIRALQMVICSHRHFDHNDSEKNYLQVIIVVIAIITDDHGDLQTT